MQYIKHNFVENYTNAVKSKDTRLADDILLDEIAKMVVFDRQAICGTLKINSSATNSVLTKKVLKLVRANPEARKILVNMIIDRNDYTKDKVTDFSFDGKGLYKNTNAKSLVDKQKVLIANSMDRTLSFDGLSESVIDVKTEQHTANQNTILGNVKSSEFNYDDFKTIALKSLLLAGLGVGVFFLAKRYFVKKALFAEGGEVEDPVAEVAPEYVAPQIDANAQQGLDNGLQQPQVPQQTNPNQFGWQPETQEQMALTQKLNIDNQNAQPNVL